MKPKTFALILCCFVITTSVAQIQPVNLRGLWRTDQDVLVRIEQSGSGIIAHYINPGDCSAGHNCPLESRPAFYVKGSMSATKMELEMNRCTHDSAMREQLGNHYVTKCKIAAFTDKNISGTWRTEYYNIEWKDEKKHFIRHKPGDEDVPFNISRTNCKKELEDLVAELERKRQALKDQRDMISDVQKNSQEASDQWYQEVVDQLKEETFHQVVPPGVKIVPGAFDQDLGSYIESWVDFLGELAEKGGHWAGEKATKIVGLYDLLIDWSNVIAKGKVTVDEINQMNEGLENMNESQKENFDSFLNALKEYEALSKLCEEEIPKEDQPKLSKNPNEEAEKLGNSHEETNRIIGNISAGLNSASNELEKTSNSVANLESLLKPYREADQNKTMQQVMTATGIQKLKNGFIEAGKNWIEVFKKLQMVQEELKNLARLYQSSVG